MLIRTFFCLSVALFFLGGGDLHAQRHDLKEIHVIQRVLSHHFGVKIERLNPSLADQEVLQALSLYDTSLSGQVYYNRDKSDQSSSIFGTDKQSSGFDIEATKRLPYGVSAKLGLSEQWNKNNSPFTTTPKYFETGLSSEISVSLLKNRAGIVDRNTVEIARTYAKGSRFATVHQIENYLHQSLANYWQIVSSAQLLSLSYRFEKIAQEFLRTTRAKKNMGLSEDTDVLAAQATVLERQNDVVVAKKLLQDYTNALKEKLNYPLESQLSVKQSLFNRKRYKSRSQAISHALENRYDYQSLKKSLEASDLKIVMEKNKKWPSLDLFSTLYFNGIDRDVGESLKRNFNFSHPNWMVGGRLQIFLENRYAKGAVKKAELNRLKTVFALKQLENQIVFEVDQAYREIGLYSKEISNYSQTVALHKQKLNSELEKFLVGRSNSDIIVRFQSEYLEQERRLLNAYFQYHLALLKMERVSSDLIPASIQIDDLLEKTPGEFEIE